MILVTPVARQSSKNYTLKLAYFKTPFSFDSFTNYALYFFKIDLQTNFSLRDQVV